ncbi:MAG: phosphoglycerate kinase [Candidatus Giovannonibacteria bacterium]|nr:phosphoglycerate kinase [Candidatus Giovannonibacteria bacterium]
MKRVLLRADFNVPLKKGRVADDFKIQKTIPTIKKLLAGNNQIFIITHLEIDGKTPNLNPVKIALEKLLGFKIGFARGKLPLKPKKFSERVVLLDNIRLNLGEKKNDLAFAKRLAFWGDSYINDAFAESHRKYASIVLLPKFLPYEAGPLLKKEIKHLSRFFKPKHPFLAVIAGKKFATKEPLISRFLKSADAVFVGGAIGNTFLARRGIGVEKSKVENIKIPKSVVWSNKILLPGDWTMKQGLILDAGPKTVKTLGELAQASKFVLWNGTLGICEKGFIYGTKTFAKELGKSKAYKVVGGGDTVAAIRKFKLEKNFDFISTGGGAMLEFLAKGTLPGIEALKKK